MRPSHVILFVCFLWPNFFIAYGQESPPMVKESICRTLTSYFSGFELNDTEALARAYHEQARFTMISVEGDGIEHLDFGEYLSAIAEHPPKISERILSLQQLDWTGNVAFAYVIIEYVGLGKRIHDFLLLLKEEDNWKIVNRTSCKENAQFHTPNWGRKISSSSMKSLDQTLDHMIRDRKSTHNAVLTAFADHGDMSFVDPRYGILTRLDKAGYASLLATQDPVKRKKVSTEWLFVSETVAVVKVKTKVPRFGCFLTDYLTIVWEEGEWKIIHKATYKPARAISVLP